MITVAVDASMRLWRVAGPDTLEAGVTVAPPAAGTGADVGAHLVQAWWACRLRCPPPPRALAPSVGVGACAGECSGVCGGGSYVRCDALRRAAL